MHLAGMGIAPLGKATKWKDWRRKFWNTQGNERFRHKYLQIPTPFSRFKSTQELEVKFKTRRLSKNFLGLLENLLHIIPSVRPSSERVLMGIDEGKVGRCLAFKCRLSHVMFPPA